MIYFDNAATTLQKPSAVYHRMLHTMQTCAGIGRGGHKPSMQAAEVAFCCRREAAKLFDAAPEQVVFTMNCTHGLNIAIHSLVQPGQRVVISGFEHNAVTRPLRAKNAKIQIAGRKLFDPTDTLRDFQRAIETKPAAVICTHVSNVFGYILPIEEIAELCKRYQVPLVIDAAQSAGVLPISLKETEAAFIAMPGHKGLYGPQGTGLLLCGQEGVPLLQGGTGSNSELQEMPDFLPDRMEAGTHNVPGIGALLEGLRFVGRKGIDTILRAENELVDAAQNGLKTLSDVRVFHGDEQCGVLSFVAEGRDCEELAQRLSEAGVAVRAGLHCAPLAHESAGTLHCGTVRISFSSFNRPYEVERFLAICKKTL